MDETDTEAEQAFERWANSPHGRIPSSAPEAHEAFLAGFQAGVAIERLAAAGLAEPGIVQDLDSRNPSDTVDESAGGS
jgi:hypothetical protein